MTTEVTFENDLNFDPVEYLIKLAENQLHPGIHIEHDKLLKAIQTLGGSAAFSVADPFHPTHVRLSLYMGFTTPENNREVPHWHSEQAEAYVILDGIAKLITKHRFHIRGDWTILVGHPGDILVAQPEVCHWFRWQSSRGIAYVFKAPQVAGQGRYPHGKTTCLHGCPIYKNGCVLPEGFSPE